MPSFKIESKINGNIEQLYGDLLTMGGANYELMPVVKMTTPSEWTEKHLTSWPIDKELFNSVILLFGLLPVDLHKIKLKKVHESGFDECSSSLINREWNHSRNITDLGSACLVSDEVEFIPKIGFFANIMKPIYKAIFNHRHKRLKEKYGASS